jgi:hypothetical protein
VQTRLNRKNFLTQKAKRFCHNANCEQKVERMVNQAKLKSYWRDPFWKFGVLVLQNHTQVNEHFMIITITKWQDNQATDMGKLS